jgi:hypothetical protein
MRIALRIILGILIALAVLQGWWFLALPLGLIGAWVFPVYAEIIIAGIAYDALFGMNGEAGMWGYAGTIVAVLLFGAVSIFKKVGRR